MSTITVWSQPAPFAVLGHDEIAHLENALELQFVALNAPEESIVAYRIINSSGDDANVLLLRRTFSYPEYVLDLLSSRGLEDKELSDTVRSTVIESLAVLQSSLPLTSAQIPSRRQEDYVLGATTAQAADIDEFSGGRLTRQRFDDGSTEVTVVITRPDLGHANDVMRLTSTENDLTVLIILLPGTTPGAHLVGRIQPDNDTVYDNLELTGPFPITSITAQDLAAVTFGVAWSGVDAVNAWDAAARATGDTDLAAAIDRGIDLS